MYLAIRRLQNILECDDLRDAYLNFKMEATLLGENSHNGYWIRVILQGSCRVQQIFIFFLFTGNFIVSIAAVMVAAGFWVLTGIVKVG